jgi:hypothetical protein
MHSRRSSFLRRIGAAVPLVLLLAYGLLVSSPRGEAGGGNALRVIVDPRLELAGMVGRIVVGEPGDGPGTKPFGYAPDARWKPVPEVARKALPSIAEIVQKGKVRTR